MNEDTAARNGVCSMLGYNRCAKESGRNFVCLRCSENSIAAEVGARVRGGLRSLQREHSMATNSPQLLPLHERSSDRFGVIVPAISSRSTFRNEMACPYSCEWQ
jgi:hypothetical protein